MMPGDGVDLWQLRYAPREGSAAVGQAYGRRACLDVTSERWLVSSAKRIDSEYFVCVMDLESSL